MRFLPFGPRSAVMTAGATEQRALRAMFPADLAERFQAAVV